MRATKRYLTTQPCYREGIYHQAGTVLTVPADEKPSKTWRLIEAEKSAPKEDKPKAEKSAPKGRASDTSVI